MIGDIEEIKKKLINGLSNNKCEIDEITIDSSYGDVTTTSCKLTMKDFEESFLTGGWTRPPKTSTQVLIENSKYGLNPYGIDNINDFWPATKLSELNERLKKINGKKIKNVIFNNPATIVFWGDGTKTVVKCDDKDEFDPEKGLAMAIAKHFMGTNKSKGDYYSRAFEKWIPKEKELPLGLKYEEDEPAVKIRKRRIKIAEDDLNG